jgi:hypothetical protein
VTGDQQFAEQQGTDAAAALPQDDGEAVAVPPIVAPVHKDAMPTDTPDEGAQL